MRINPMVQNAYANPVNAAASVKKPDASPDESFAAQLKSTIGEVSRMQADADAAMAEGAAGGAENIHENMIRIEEADISLRLLTRVRNKALDAYHELMRMQF